MKDHLNTSDIQLIDNVIKNIKEEKKYIRAYRYIGKYLAQMDRVSDDAVHNTSVLINQTIWICWLQGIERAPKLVQRCMESIDRNKPESWQIVIITLDNIRQYIELPGFIWQKYEKGIISNTHLSDLIRLELLSRYGGCWIDATVFCSDEIPSYMLADELFLFKGPVNFPSVLQISSWWIAAKKGNVIIRRMLECLWKYWEQEDKLIHYYLLHITLTRVINENSSFRETFLNIRYANNSHPHILQGWLREGYNEDKWKEIKQVSSVHKLTYKKRILRGNSYSFYDALIDNKL